MRSLVAVAAIVALAILAVSCGGADDSATGSDGREFQVTGADTTVTPVNSLTKAKFLAHANDLCRRKWPFILNAARQTANFTRKLHPETSELEQYRRGVRISYYPAIDFHLYDEIQRLGGPPGETQTIEEVLGSMQEAVERGQRMVTSSPAQVEKLFSVYNQIARHYGLDECLFEGGHLPYPGTLRAPGRRQTLPANSSS
jgi:hypothetical protein